ncbi:MAG TPA: alpha/beta hydrolase [Hyphomicrobiaceae bacterium]|nr:alpha/beta hydrolase [Hyphomicrobiaceae bacterium]
MRLHVDGHETEVGTGGRPIDPARPAVVFVHGAGMDHTCWMPQARAYAYAGWTVLAPDLPAHGRSAGAPLPTIDAMAAWIMKLLDATGIEKAAIVGHSMGGAIALQAAASHPARVSHIGVIGSGAAIPVSPALLETAANRPEDAYEMMTTWSHAPASRMGGNPIPGLWMVGMARAIFARNRPGLLASDLKACDDWKNGPACAAAVKCPAVVVGAALDLMTPPKRSAELASAVTGARLVTIPASGHMIMAEAPEACLAALRTVIR